MKEYLKQPALNKYSTSYQAGEFLFREGEDSQDLYILVSGDLDVFKGEEHISEITEPGTLFGEMSFLLRSKRTATISARNIVTVIRLPSGEVNAFLDEFPAIAREITSILARRLDETTNVMHGLKEFCNHLPDAVIMTDKEQKILAWNKPAEKLYGRAWSQMKNKSIDEIYDNQAAYKQFMAELNSNKTVKEQILKINHPFEEWKFVSTSTTILYDHNHQARGYLFLGRDVTRSHGFKRKQQMTRKFIYSLLLITLITSGLFFVKMQVLKDQRHEATQVQKPFTSRIARDSMGLSLVLSRPLGEGDIETSTRVMDDYFAYQNPGDFGIIGLLLLDKDNRIVNAYTPESLQSPFEIRGTAYSGSRFHTESGPEESRGTVYLVSRGPESQTEGADLSFDITRGGEHLGSLIFQLDMEKIDKQYDIGIKTLSELDF